MRKVQQVAKDVILLSCSWKRHVCPKRWC